MIRKNFTAKELRNMFHDIVYSCDGEFTIWCAFNNGIFVDKDPKPTPKKINDTREAVMSLFDILLDSIDPANGKVMPTTTVIASFYDSMSNIYTGIMSMVDGDMEKILLNAFFYRIFAYEVQEFISELFYIQPVEEVVITWNKDEEED